MIDEIEAAVRGIRARADLQPRAALVLGSGLGALADAVDGVAIPYRDIPGFPESTAPGHHGHLVIGYLEGVPVALLAGRAHLYEGYTAAQVAFPTRVMAALGARSVVLTNAAGGVSSHLRPGTLMLISDHLNLTGRNPLIGPNDPQLGLRFPDMSFAYDPALRQLAREVAETAGLQLHEGVYAGVLGPSYETPAEIRMVRAIGGDAVGMSTIMEAIAARHLGMRVIGISCITNLAAGIGHEPLSEDEVIETAGRVREEFSTLVRGIVARLGDGDGEDARVP